MKLSRKQKQISQLWRQSRLTLAIRHIFIVSLGTGFSSFVYAENSAIPSVVEQPDESQAAEQSDGPQKVEFSSGFLHGGNIDVERFSEGNPAPAGKYATQVSVNGERRGEYQITFIPVEGSVSAVPCFTRQELTDLGIIPNQDSDTKAGVNAEQCARLGSWVKDSKADYQSSDFQLNLTIPQAYTVQYPRGYTDPNTWDPGIPAALMDYNANLYAQQNTSNFRNNSDNHSLSGNLGLLTGLNFKGWRLRNRINTTWDEHSSSHTQNLFTYLQRDVPALKSELTLGDATTSGLIFDSLTIRGIQLQSEDRMLPDGLRNYTPVINGIAETNARVRITQRGQTVYETTVPAGPFTINDVGAMGYGGDLEMTITEADGRVRTQIIPFSAPPMLLHKGVSNFGITAGKLKDDTLRERPKVIQGIYQYGLGSMYTLYGGGQFSEHYSALAFGTAFNTPVGGFSADITRARTELRDDRVSMGNSYNIGYSKHLDSTDTDVTLAAYRYSSKGFYNLRDAAVERDGSKDDYYRVDYRTRQRMTMTMSQPLWNGARINLSGSYYNYWDGRGSARQFMVSYNKTERYFSWGISGSRSYSDKGKNVNTVMLSVSIPLGHNTVNDRPVFSSLYTTATRDNDGGASFQTSALGSRGEQNELTYGIGAAVNKTRHDTTQGNFNGNVTYNSPYGILGSTASLGNKSRQLSLSANGSVVAHSGGITLGPRIGDSPFALVSAPGAGGARLNNGYGSRIDSRGYAIVPSLTPYRKNDISIRTDGLPETVDVLDSESTVIPRMGAAVKVNMQTRIGAPAVLIVRDAKGSYLPIGSDLLDKKGNSLGIVGQAGMAFVRGWEAGSSDLRVNNGAGGSQCVIRADKNIEAKIKNASQGISQVEVICQ